MVGEETEAEEERMERGQELQGCGATEEREEREAIGCVEAAEGGEDPEREGRR